MARFFASLLLLGVLVVALTACQSSSSSGSAGKPVVVKYSESLAPDHPNAVLLKWGLDEIEKRSQGKVKFEYYPSGSLVGGGDILEAVKVGGVTQAGGDIPSYHPATIPFWAVYGLPFSSKTTEGQLRAFWKAYETMPELKAQYEKNNNVIPMVIVSTPSYSIISTKPIEKLEDLKGLKIRTTGFYAEWLNLVGSTGVAIPFNEAYEQLQKGTVDGTFTDEGGGVSARFHEVAKHFTSVEFGATSMLSVINADVYKSLGPDVQKVITDVGKDSIQKVIDEQKKAQVKGAEDLKKAGVTFHTLSPQERARWTAPAQQMFDKWANDREKEGLPGKKFLELFISTSKQYE